jgi:DNA-binding IclR family transcriptional regulator
MAGTQYSRQNVKALFKMLDVLDSFSIVDRELSVIEIAERTSFPRSTVHRLVDSLRLVGLLEQEASRERYRLGLKLFQLGNTALANMPLYREAGPFISTLAKLSGETVQLCVFDGTQMVFVDRMGERARPHNTVTTLEATSCHSTAIGKVTLAYQSEATIERIIQRGLQSYTPATITDPARLREELTAIRARGYAIDNCEHESELRCVAGPIRNSMGRVFAAVSVTGHMKRITDARIPLLADQVVTHARLISVQLGCWIEDTELVEIASAE